jgi:membrane-associated phospholipid phosphatase
LTFLTDFADQAVVLPLVFAVAVVLAFQRWRRGAAGWFVAIGGTLAAMLVLKLVFHGCVAIFGQADLHSPSGHVAAATVVCGGLAAIYGGGRRAVLSIAILTAVTIGITRIALLQHSWPEVMLGAAIGVAGAMAVARLAGPPPSLRLRPMVLTAAVILALFHGRHLEAERVIQRAATLSGWFPAWCQGASQPR